MRLARYSIPLYIPTFTLRVPATSVYFDVVGNFVWFAHEQWDKDVLELLFKIVKEGEKIPDDGIYLGVISPEDGLLFQLTG